MALLLIYVMVDNEDTRSLKTLSTGFEILELLQTHDEMGVTEIANSLDLSKGTLHPYLATLERKEYLVNDSGRYSLSLRFLQLGEYIKNQLQAYDEARNELDNLAGETGELAQFAVEEHGKAIYLYKAGGESAVQTASEIGKREFLHCIALGKAMLAYMPESRVHEIIDKHGLERQTPNTITNREDLFDELDQIRKQGYATDLEEKIKGLRCIAAPILDSEDQLIGAISVSGPAQRMQGMWFEEELPDEVRRSSNVIEINTHFSQ